MLNIHARASVSRALEPLGTSLARRGVTPNAITVIGTVGSVAAALIFFTQGWWFTGTMIIWGFVMLDVVDGAVARAGGTSSAFGGVLDSTCDRVADAAVFGSLAWYFARHDQPSLLLAALLCLVLGTLTSYIRARAEAAGLNATVGVAERAERLIIVLVGTGLSGEHLEVPYVQAIALWVLVAASAVTVGQRLATVYTQSQALQRAGAGVGTVPAASPPPSGPSAPAPASPPQAGPPHNGPPSAGPPRNGPPPAPSGASPASEPTVAP